MDNKKIAHDIAISILPEILKHNGTELYLFDKTDRGTINSNEIVGTYHDSYKTILDELNSHP